MGAVAKTAYTLDPVKSEWADYAVQAYHVGTHQGDEFTGNSSGNTRPQPSHLDYGQSDYKRVDNRQVNDGQSDYRRVDKRQVDYGQSDCRRVDKRQVDYGQSD